MKAFACIAVDPPWRFTDRGSRIAPDHKGRHYDTMDTDQIVALGQPLRAVVASRSHLWLWAPNAFVIDGTAQRVAQLWGWRPRQMLTWGKPHIGMGHWLRNSTEQLLFCTRGRPLSSTCRSQPTLVLAKRGAHSAKPAEAYEAINRVSPGPRLELFARAARKGWTTVGDGIDGRHILTSLCDLALMIHPI